MNEKRKPNYKDPNKQPNPILSMKEKTKENLGASQCKWKIVLSNQQAQDKHQTLNSRSQREWKCQQELRNES